MVEVKMLAYKYSELTATAKDKAVDEVNQDWVHQYEFDEFIKKFEEKFDIKIEYNLDYNCIHYKGDIENYHKLDDLTGTYIDIVLEEETLDQCLKKLLRLMIEDWEYQFSEEYMEDQDLFYNSKGEILRDYFV